MALILRNFYPLTLFLGRHFRGLFGYTERDVELLYPLKEKMFYSIMRESGYMHIQSTKPDTVGECSGGACLVACSTGAKGRRFPFLPFRMHPKHQGSAVPHCRLPARGAALGGLHYTSVLTASSLVPGLSCSLSRSLASSHTRLCLE